MEMHQIRYFLAVAQTLNFTKAAEECHVARPSLSRAIKKLEDELGGDLFRRERSLTHLTELGRMMLPLLTQAYDTASSAKSLASIFRKGAHAPLRMALSTTFDMRLLVPPLSSLMEAMPGVELKFFRGTVDEIAEQLKGGDFELGIGGPLTSNWDRFKAWPLFNTSFNLFAHKDHPLVRTNRIDAKQLAGARVLSRPYCEARQPIADLLSENGVFLSDGDTIASDQDVLALVGSGIGVSIMPAITPCGEDMRSLPIEGLEFECLVSLYSVIGRQHSPAAAAMIQLLRAANWARLLDRRSTTFAS